MLVESVSLYAQGIQGFRCRVLQPFCCVLSSGPFFIYRADVLLMQFQMSKYSMGTGS